jgi:hypothetical protein
MKRNDLSRSLVAFEQNSTLVAVVELSLNSWLVAGLVPGLNRQPLKKVDTRQGGFWRWFIAGGTRRSGLAVRSSG